MPKFGWKAIYEDGVIRQYPFGLPETNFKEVVDKGMPTKFFVGRVYGVNLVTGELLINGKWVSVGDMDAVRFKPTKLVYFRRNFATVNAELKESSRKIFHFVGYQYEINGSLGQVRLCIPDNKQEQPTICIGL